MVDFLIMFILVSELFTLNNQPMTLIKDNDKVTKIQRYRL